VALVATFLLLVAGVLVSAPGMMSASASGSPSTTDQVDDNENEDENQAEDEDQDEPEVECQAENEHENEDEGENQNDDENHSGDDSSGHSSDDDETSAFSVDSVNQNEDENQNEDDDEDQHEVENQHDDDDEDENQNCVATLTVVKSVQNDDGGNAAVADFPLQVNGEPVTSGVPVSVATGIDLTISETQQPGYVAVDINCVSTDPNSSNTFDLGEPLDPALLATINISATESVVCTIVNDDVAPTVTVHKVVVGGTALAAEFQMTVDGNPVDQDTPSPTHSNTPIVVSEIAVPGYQQTSVECTDNDANSAPVVHPLVLDEGQNVTCVVTNTFQTASVTVVKAVTNDSGGNLAAADFDLTLDDVVVAQGTAINVDAGAHVIGEIATPGYAQASIVCNDDATAATVGDAGSIVVDRWSTRDLHGVQRRHPGHVEVGQATDQRQRRSGRPGKLPVADRRCQRAPARRQLRVGRYAHHR
jgi:hypothetical protein